jgi:hypothetical protein
MMKEQQARIEAHEKLRQSQPYTDATMRVQRITLDFVETVRAAWFFATRDPNSGKYVFWRFTDDLLGSALAIWMTSREGIDTVPRRELRFMLELAIRNAYVDLVYASAETSLDTRMAYVEHKLEGDIVLLDELPLTIYWADPSPLKNEVEKRLYGELSKYVHSSHEQMGRRLALADRGVFLGFETRRDSGSRRSTAFFASCRVSQCVPRRVAASTGSASGERLMNGRSSRPADRGRSRGRRDPAPLLGNKRLPNRCSCPSVRAVNRRNVLQVQLLGDLLQ